MVEKQYRSVKEPINSTLIVVQDHEYHWGVVDTDGNIVVPFGKYAWIDGFQNGLAKVIGHDDTTSPHIIAIFDENWNDVTATDRVAEQGIINENGIEVLPLEYNIWKFYGKDFPTIKYFKGNEQHTIRYEALNPDLEVNTESKDDGRNGYDYYDDYDSSDYMRDSWYAMTDGMYGDMPDGFNGDFDFLGY